MKYCSQCGETVSHRIPEGDNRHRYVCDSCDHIHYQNPRIIVGTLPVYEDKILLCRRAIEPRAGYWTLPAGFLEVGETSIDGAFRETWEEAQAEVANGELYCVFDLPHISQVYMFYRADLPEPKFAPGVESTDVRLFTAEDIPWDELAFPVVNETLHHYLSDRELGSYPVRVKTVEPMSDYYK